MPTIDETIKELQDAATAASLHYDVWWVLKSKDSRPQHVRTMNKYLQFFRSSISAHFVAMLVALYRVYETRKDTHNITVLIKEIENQNLLSAQALASIKQKCESAKPLWVKISILRNEVFGHRTIGNDSDSVFIKANLKPNDLRDLVSITKEILNDLTGHLRDSMHAFNLSATQDTKKLLEDLSKSDVAR